jgi:O-antigen/teichoic acid export membrane protein
MSSPILKNLETKIIKVLRKTERYTRTDMLYVFRSGFWSLFSQGIGSLSSFVVVVLLANLLSKESFGQYRFILSIISILTLFTLPGIATAITRAIARKQNVDFPKIARIKIQFGFIGLWATLAMALFYFLNGNTELASALIVTAIFLPFIEPFAIYGAYYKGKQDFKTGAIYESISRIFQSAVIIIMALITKNILAILGAFLAGQILARFFFYKKTMRDAGLQAMAEDLGKDHDEDIIKYGKHLSGIQILSTITANIDKLLVWHFLGAEILAIYYVALTIPKNIVLLCNIIPRIALPKFSQNTWEPHERAKIVRKLFLFLGMLMIPAILYFLLVPFVMPIIFKTYAASLSVAGVLAFLIILAPANAMINQILQAKKSVNKIIILQIVTLVVFAAVFLVMYIHLGPSAMAAATALIISEAVPFGIGIFFVR